VHSLWIRQPGTSLWTLELMLDECIDDVWVYRRDEAIRRPLSTLIQRGAVGLPYLAPEIQLLYKARSPRSYDQIDFDRIAPRLTAAARRWLLESLECAEPHRPWITALGQMVKVRVGGNSDNRLSK
jgi:hypothetical protein